MVTIALANSVEWFVAFAACWKIGAIPQPVSAKLPPRELQAILELADPSLVLGVPAASAGSRRTLPAGYQPDPRPARWPTPRRHLAGVEGTDLWWLDGPTKAHRFG